VTQDIETAADAAAASPEPDESVDGPRGFYADDVPFRSGVVQVQSPLHMAVVAALNGFNPPRPEGHFRYCDLGCGNGTTVNAFAAIHPEAEFVGIDFNAGHIAHARAQAEAAGLTNVRFIQGSFTEVTGGDLPMFDFIGMNGIYSWLDRDVLPSVHALVRRHLKPGGLFYVEYMCMPGMIAVVPLWHLIQALVPPGEDGSHERATRGLRVLEELSRSGMRYLDQHPTAQAAARGYVSRWHDNPKQIDHFAHNALASGFRPRFITEMCEEMAAAGLVFGGRTHLGLNDPDLAVTLEQASILNGIEDRQVRELLLDYMRNERNRRDVYVKADSMDARDPRGARDFLLNEVRLLGRVPMDRLPRAVDMPGPRKLRLEGPAYDRLFAAFDGAARTLREADADGELRDETLIAAGHRLLVAGNHFLCAPDFAGGPLPEAPEGLRVPLAFNRLQLDQAQSELAGVQLVSPAVGGAVLTLGPLEAVMLQAWITAGRSQSVETARGWLAEKDGKVQINKQTRPVRELDAEVLGQVLARLANIRVPNMIRTGVLSPVA